MIAVALAAASEIAKSKLREAKVNTGYTIAAAATGCVAVSFAVIAATAALTDAVGFIGACLIMSGIFTVFFVLVLLLRSNARLNAKHKTPKADPAVSAALTSLAKTPPTSPIAMSFMALAAGFLLSKKK